MCVCGLTSEMASSAPDRGAARRRPAERRERQLEQQPDEEHRCGVHEDREQPQDDVGEPVAVARGHAAQRHADAEGHDQRPERELEGGGAVRHQDLAHRAVVGEGAAEVALEQAAHVLPVLGEDRPVEAGGGLALGDLRRSEPATEGRRDRVADDPHQDEHHRDEDPQHRDDEGEPHQEIAGQGAEPARAFRLGFGLRRPGGRDDAVGGGHLLPQRAGGGLSVSLSPPHQNYSDRAAVTSSTAR